MVAIIVTDPPFSIFRAIPKNLRGISSAPTSTPPDITLPVPDPLRLNDLPIRVSGLPACLAPGTQLVAERKILPRDLFDPNTGRLHLRALARYHLTEQYRAKALRCDDCITYHVIRCHQEGVTDAEIEEVLSVGMVVGGSITIPHLRRALQVWDELE